MLEGEPASGAAEPGHDLVADPEDLAGVAQAAELFEVARRRYEHAAARPADSLQQDGGGAAGVEAPEIVAEPGDALGLGGAARRDLEPVDLGGGDALARLDQRAVGGGVPRLAGRAEGARGVAVIADGARREPVLVGLAARRPVHVRDLHRDLVRLGAAADEQGVVEAAAEPGRDQVRQPLGGLVPELAAVHVVDGRELVAERRQHLRVAVSQADRQRARRRVDVVEAGLVEDPRALGRHGQRQRPRRGGDQRGRLRCGTHGAPA